MSGLILPQAAHHAEDRQECSGRIADSACSSLARIDIHL
jgi:hypothetical protein